MEHAIAITRSQLRQVIEDYIAASRVGDTLSYVETAKLSTAEAAESSTARIWEGLHAFDNVVVIHDLEGTVTPTLEQAREPEEFVCVEDLAAGQVVIVNSRGMIEGKRDDNDALVIEASGPRGLIDDQCRMPDADRGQPEAPGESADDNESMFA